MSPHAPSDRHPLEEVGKTDVLGVVFCMRGLLEGRPAGGGEEGAAGKRQAGDGQRGTGAQAEAAHVVGEGGEAGRQKMLLRALVTVHVGAVQLLTAQCGLLFACTPCLTGARGREEEPGDRGGVQGRRGRAQEAQGDGQIGYH